MTPTPSPFPTPYPNLFGIDWPTSISIALALTAALMAIITIALVLCGIYAFFDFKKTAAQQAETTAGEIAARVAAEKTSALLAEMLPREIKAQLAIFGKDSTSDAQANQIAESESDETSNPAQPKAS